MSDTASRSSPPTTKILALGTGTAPLTDEQEHTIMPQEVPATVRLYLDGKIDQWFARKDGKGVVFLLNITSLDEAAATLNKLPLAQQGLMTFELIPLGPITPINLLLQHFKID